MENKTPMIGSPHGEELYGQRRLLLAPLSAGHAERPRHHFCENLDGRALAAEGLNSIARQARAVEHDCHNSRRALGDRLRALVAPVEQQRHEVGPNRAPRRLVAAQHFARIGGSRVSAQKRIAPEAIGVIGDDGVFLALRLVEPRRELMEKALRERFGARRFPNPYAQLNGVELSLEPTSPGHGDRAALKRRKRLANGVGKRHARLGRLRGALRRACGVGRRRPFTLPAAALARAPLPGRRLGRSRLARDSLRRLRGLRSVEVVVHGAAAMPARLYACARVGSHLLSRCRRLEAPLAPAETAPNSKRALGVSVVVPAYNEERGVAEVVRELRELASRSKEPFEILVVDDGSTDGTPRELASVEREPGAPLRVLRNEPNRGYGYSLKRGIREATYDVVVITDADGTYPNGRIPELVERVRAGAAMAVGARSLASASVPLVRKPAKWLLNTLANFLAGRKVPDLNSGLRAMKHSLVARFEPILPDGFSFTTTITLAALTNAFRVDFLPIDYAKRQGTSKIRPIYDTANFFNLVVRTVLYFRPLKVFTPLAVFGFVVAGAIAVRDAIAAWREATSLSLDPNDGRRMEFWDALIKSIGIGDVAYLTFFTSLQVLLTGYLADLACEWLRPEHFSGRQGARARFYRQPLSFFATLAVVAMVVAIYFHYRDSFVYFRPLRPKTLVTYGGALQVFCAGLLADVLVRRSKLRDHEAR